MMITVAQLAPTFIVPGLAVAGIAAISIPIVIHILSRRPRKPEPWAAMRFLLAAYRKHRMRTRLEQWILLAMRCLLVALLGIALAGPVSSAVGSLTGLGGGRTVVLVIDDSITSGAVDAPGHTRLATLQESADKLLSALAPGDRAALVTASRPATAIVAPPTVDPMAVRGQVRQLAPAPAAADLPGALRLAREILAQEPGPPASAYLVMLSDFSAGAVEGDHPSRPGVLPRELADLGSLASLIRNDPLPPASNVQIADFRPEARVVIGQTAGQKPTVAWTLRLRRQMADPAAPAPAAAITVRLKVHDAQPIRRTLSFATGELELEHTVSIAVEQPGLIAAELSLEPSAEGADALAIDNVRHATVRVRQKMNVMLVGDGAGFDASSQFTPQRWLTTALAPVSDRLGWPIDARSVEAPAVGTQLVDLTEADAVLVLRPDQLTEEGFTSLARWAQAGGFVWFFAPAGAEAATLWPQQLVAAFKLPWSIERRIVAYPDSEPLRLKTDAPATGELDRLSTDLPDLLQPVEIFRHLAVDRASLGAASDVLLTGAGGEPIMIAAGTDSSQGRVMFLATAVDAAWTNLPAKPLMVPLLHETLRAALDRLQPAQVYEPGDQPTLGPSWDAVTRLTAPDGESMLLVRDGAPGPRPMRPLNQAGVYRTETEALVVNVNSDAADTRRADPAAVSALLSAAGSWRSADLDEPAGALASSSQGADLSWPLLLAVLALAVLEMFFARIVSHARATDRASALPDMTRQAA